MAITNLQQARQLYAMGQRVGKTMDGSRPGYRGDYSYGSPSRSSSQGPAGGASSGGNYGGNRQSGANYGERDNLPSSNTPIGGQSDNRENYRGTTDYITSVTPERVKSSQREYLLGVDGAYNPLTYKGTNVIGPFGVKQSPYHKFLSHRPDVPNIPLGPFSVLSNFINPKGVQPVQAFADFTAGINRPFFINEVVRAGKIPGLNYATIKNMTNEELEAAYKKYDRARLSGQIDAYGNPHPTYGKDQGDYSDSGLLSLGDYNMFDDQNNQDQNQNTNDRFVSRFLQNQPDDIRENIEESMQNYYTV
jgi:hypothetical protein